MKFEVQYAKALFLKIFEKDLIDIGAGLKDTLILISFSAKTASLRSRGLKAIGKLIRQQRDIILDEKIQSLLHLRARDTSVVARESTLEMLQQFLGRKSPQSQANDASLKKFLAVYLRLIVEKAGDKSHLVRRKVIQLLSAILDHVRDGQETTSVLKVLLL